MKYTLVLSSFLVFSSLCAAPQDEILVLEELVQVTKKNLESQQILLKLTIDFQEAREAFIADPESGKLASRLVKRAISLQKHLENEHLSHLFSSEFLQELAFYNQIGKQQLARE